MRGRCAGCSEDRNLLWGLCEACRDRVDYAPGPIFHHTCANAVYVTTLYQDPLRQWIMRWKFYRERHFGKTFGAMMADAAIVLGLYEGDVLVMPVPLHPSRMRQRGFNQSEVLAVAVGRAAKLPLGDELIKSERTKDQVGLTAVERRENLRSAFTLARPIPPVSILLIDDICTTGSTIDACAKVLLEGGAKEVRALTLCGQREASGLEKDSVYF